MHSCITAVIYILVTLHCHPTVVSEMTGWRAAFVANSFLFEKGFSFFDRFSSEAPTFPECMWFIVYGTVLSLPVILLCEGVYAEVSSRRGIYVLWTDVEVRVFVYLLFSFSPFTRATALQERVKLGSFLVRASWQINSMQKENGRNWPLCSSLNLEPWDINFSWIPYGSVSTRGPMPRAVSR